MFNRKVAITFAIAALAPVISFASSERNSVKACASAFAASIPSAAGTAPAYKLNYSGDAATTMSAFYQSDYSFALEARNPKTGAPIARAICSTDRHGSVTGISAVPLDAKGDAMMSQD